MAAQRAQRAVPIGEGCSLSAALRSWLRVECVLELHVRPRACSSCRHSFLLPLPAFFIQGSPTSITLSLNGTNSSATIIDDLSTCQDRTAGGWFANDSTAQELLQVGAPRHCNVCIASFVAGTQTFKR